MNLSEGAKSKLIYVAPLCVEEKQESIFYGIRLYAAELTAECLWN